MSVKKPILSGNSFQTGIIFSKSTPSETLYSASARAEDGDVSVTCFRLVRENATSSHLLIRCLKKFFPSRPSSSARAAVLKSLEDNIGKFVEEISLDKEGELNNRAVALITSCFMLLIYAVVQIFLT